MNDIYEVKVTKYPAPGQRITSTMIYDNYEDALEYAKIKRRYKCHVIMIHRYEVEETVYDRMSV